MTMSTLPNRFDTFYNYLLKWDTQHVFSNYGKKGSMIFWKFIAEFIIDTIWFQHQK